MIEKSFDGEGMSPAKSGDSMERVTLRLPGGLLEDYEAIAQRRGVDVSALLREGLENGLPTLLQREAAKLDYENKQLVNRKLKLSISRLEQNQTPDEID